MKLREKLDKIMNEDRQEIKSHLTCKIKVNNFNNKNKKVCEKQLSLEKNNFNNSLVRLDSLELNPDETIAKLNISNNDLFQLELNKQKREYK